jgi:hypothetical protein
MQSIASSISFQNLAHNSSDISAYIAAISRASFAALGWMSSGFIPPLTARKAFEIPL